MTKDCQGCVPRGENNLCSVHARAYSMRDLLREIADAYLERAAAVLSKQTEPDPGRLPKAMAKVTALLAIIQAEQREK
jgi:hypothetical protein